MPINVITLVSKYKEKLDLNSLPIYLIYSRMQINDWNNSVFN